MPDDYAGPARPWTAEDDEFPNGCRIEWRTPVGTWWPGEVITRHTQPGHVVVQLDDDRWMQPLPLGELRRIDRR